MSLLLLTCWINIVGVRLLFDVFIKAFIVVTLVLRIVVKVLLIIVLIVVIPSLVVEVVDVMSSGILSVLIGLLSILL